MNEELMLLRELAAALEEYDRYIDLSEPIVCPVCGPDEPDAFLSAQQVLSNRLLDYLEWKGEARR